MKKFHLFVLKFFLACITLSAAVLITGYAMEVFYHPSYTADSRVFDHAIGMSMHLAALAIVGIIFWAVALIIYVFTGRYIDIDHLKDRIYEWADSDPDAQYVDVTEISKEVHEPPYPIEGEDKPKPKPIVFDPDEIVL